MSTNENDRDDTALDTNAVDSDPSSTDQPVRDARAELLAVENHRLRTEYARARQSSYRRTALWLAGVGAVAVLGGLLFPAARQILFVLGAIGLFGGILTHYLSPEQFVAAGVGERVYTASAANWARLINELSLQNEFHYLPRNDSSPPRLFVPQRTRYEIPEDRSGPVTTRDEERGLVLEPTGATLFDEFERTLVEPLATEPTTLATQLADGLVEQFELAESAEPDADPDGGRITVAIETSAFGAVDRFDHPTASFLAVGVVEGLDRPVELTVDSGDQRADWLITCRWEETQTD